MENHRSLQNDELLETACVSTLVSLTKVNCIVVSLITSARDVDMFIFSVITFKKMISLVWYSIGCI